MFKSIVSGVVAASVLLAPVAAEARGRSGHHDGRDRGSHIDTGEAIAIGLGAFILGAAVSGGNRTDRGVDTYEDRYERPRYRGRDSYYRPDRNCHETVVTQYDEWGNRYLRRETRCF